MWINVAQPETRSGLESYVDTSMSCFYWITCWSTLHKISVAVTLPCSAIALPFYLDDLDGQIDVTQSLLRGSETTCTASIATYVQAPGKIRLHLAGSVPESSGQLTVEYPAACGVHRTTHGKNATGSNKRFSVKGVRLAANRSFTISQHLLVIKQCNIPSD